MWIEDLEKAIQKVKDKLKYCCVHNELHSVLMELFLKLRQIQISNTFIKQGRSLSMIETVGEKAKRISEPFSALVDELLMSGSLFPREQAILEQVEEIIEEVAKQ